MTKQKFMLPAIFFAIALMAILAAFTSIKLAVAVFAGLLVILLTFLQPFFGLIVYLILLYIRPHEFILVLSKLRIMLSMGILILLSFVIQKVIRREKITILPTRQHKLVLILLLIVPLSHITNGRLMESWESFSEFLGFFILYFIITNTTDSIAKFHKIVWTLVTCTLLLALNGIIQFYRGVDLLGNPLVAGRIRWVGIFGNPNDLALLIVTIIPFTLYALMDRYTRAWKKPLLLLMTASFITAIYFTNSRGGFIALVAMLVFFSFKRWGLLRGIIVGVVFLALGLAVTPSRMADLSPYGDSASGRVYAWIEGLAMVKMRPIFGVGYKNFTFYQGRAAHSAFVQCFAELGIVGYYFWLALIYTSVSDLFRIERFSDEGEDRNYVRVLQLSFIGFLASALFLSQAYSPIFFTIGALSTVFFGELAPGGRKRGFLTMQEAGVIAAILVFSVIIYKVLAIVYI